MCVILFVLYLGVCLRVMMFAGFCNLVLCFLFMCLWLVLLYCWVWVLFFIVVLFVVAFRLFVYVYYLLPFVGCLIGYCLFVVSLVNSVVYCNVHLLSLLGGSVILLFIYHVSLCLVICLFCLFVCFVVLLLSLVVCLFWILVCCVSVWLCWLIWTCFDYAGLLLVFGLFWMLISLIVELYDYLYCICWFIVWVFWGKKWDLVLLICLVLRCFSGFGDCRSGFLAFKLVLLVLCFDLPAFGWV